MYLFSAILCANPLIEIQFVFNTYCPQGYENEIKGMNKSSSESNYTFALN